MSCDLCFVVCYNLQWVPEASNDVVEDKLFDVFFASVIHGFYFCSLHEVVDGDEEVFAPLEAGGNGPTMSSLHLAKGIGIMTVVIAVGGYLWMFCVVDTHGMFGQFVMPPLWVLANSIPTCIARMRPAWWVSLVLACALSRMRAPFGEIHNRSGDPSGALLYRAPFTITYNYFLSDSSFLHFFVW